MTYKKQTYDWTNDPIVYENTPDTFKRFDAYIISEKFDFYQYSSIMQVHNHLKMKANTIDGIDKINSIDLPANFSYTDETYYDPEKMRDTLLRPLVLDVEMVRFGCRIIKPNGSVQNAVVNDYTKSLVIMSGKLPYSIYKFYFDIKNIEPNDIVEIDYLYNMPYKSNFNGYTIQPKINFAGKLPKENYTYKLEWELKDVFVFITGFNSAATFDTIINYKTNRQSYIWKGSNLFQVANECNSHLYTETPYIKFYYPYYTNNPQLHYRRPMLWYDILSQKYDYVKNNAIKLDPEINALSGLYTYYKYKSSDTSVLGKLKELHHYVNYQLKYQEDSAYFAGEDNTLSRIDVYLKNEIFRYRSRHKFYKYLFDITGAEYYIGVAPDKRVDVINADVPNAINEVMYFFVLLQNKKLYYFYPKLFDHGYHVNEMPYYIENQTVLLVKQNDDVSNPRNYIIHTTPFSLKNDNYRSTKSKVTISLATQSATFNTSLSLWGQMSTMSRASYTTGIVNQYANLDYGKRIYDLGKSQFIKQTIKTENDEYPFNIDLDIEHKNDLIQQTGSNYLLQVNRLLMPIIPYKFEKVRTTNYYTDFMYKDNYRYMLQFDENVSIEDINQTFSNSYGKVIFTLSKVDSKTYSLVCSMDIYKSVATPQEYEDVKAFYTFISKLNQMNILIQKVD